jgi:hypothetical protein
LDAGNDNKIVKVAKILFGVFTPPTIDTGAWSTSVKRTALLQWRSTADRKAGFGHHWFFGHEALRPMWVEFDWLRACSSAAVPFKRYGNRPLANIPLRETPDQQNDGKQNP